MNLSLNQLIYKLDWLTWVLLMELIICINNYNPIIMEILIIIKLLIFMKVPQRLK